MPLTPMQEAALYGDSNEWDRLRKAQQTRDDILESFLRAHPSADQDDVQVDFTSGIVTWDKPYRDQLAMLTYDILGDGSEHNPYRFER